MAILRAFRSAPQGQEVVLAIGGNLAGDYPSLEALMEAALSDFPRAGLRILRRSGWWRSAAWPDPTAPDYLNAVVVVETALSPRQTLDAALAIEARFGRTRSRPNAPRTLDIDLVAYGRQVIDAPGLVVPHPRAHERRFVMGPLAEIAPDWVHPRLGETAAELARSATVGADAQPLRKLASGHSGET